MATSTMAAIPAQTFSDAEWVRTNWQEGIWVGIDAIGTARNGSSAMQALFEATRFAAPISRTLGPIVPMTQLITGPLCVFSAFQHTLPGAIKELNGVDPEDQEGKHVARLGLVNQVFFVKMGVATTACGVVGMMSPALAEVMHYQPVLTHSTASTASLISGAALGGIYLVRGSIILGKAGYNLHYLNEFQSEFDKKSQNLINAEEGIINKEVLDAAVSWLNEQRYDEKGNEKTSFMRRAGEGCPEVDTESLVKDKIEYLAQVDKGIHTKKMQQVLSIIIGISMVLGGILLIASFCLGGPLTPLILTIIAGVFFATMESVYLHYDSSFLFEKLRERLYTESKVVQEARLALKALESVNLENTE